MNLGFQAVVQDVSAPCWRLLGVLRLSQGPLLAFGTTEECHNKCCETSLPHKLLVRFGKKRRRNPLGEIKEVAVSPVTYNEAIFLVKASHFGSCALITFPSVKALLLRCEPTALSHRQLPPGCYFCSSVGVESLIEAFTLRA